ncbi:MAG: PAS domain-containing protein [Alphaproteobacteria bacterium]|nr:MAG: PAS domain-containing protein [Alphaproteobacteria bacterium]
MPAARGSAGIAIDVTEAELMRGELKRMMDAHRRTLDQLATGVAIFGSDRRLSFYNAAYRSLWDLEAAFLDQGPTDSAVLDRLRAARKLPDEQDFRQWKNALYDAYRAVEAKEHMWHLPHGRTMRVVTTPNSEGGVIYLFDDVTERLDLERRYDALIRVQSETLDNLTEAVVMRGELKRMMDAHRRTLDQLATGVAIFGSDRRLSFYNAAYRSLWDLEAAFLDQGPTDSAVLDRLRAARKLPDEQDFRQWKNALYDAYRAVEAKEHMWHLPHGRTMRVVTTPNSEGGVIYLFDDVTERLDLERRYDALIRVQSETLDNLTEAVAVFGSDGRLRLHNPAFARMWRLSPEMLSGRPHIESISDWTRPLHGEHPVWQKLRATITAIDNREPALGRLERRHGTVLDCATMPLHDGATLVAFEDVTDTVNVERALRERNEALKAADKLKTDFVHHVSYELRSPLTNIIGFADFLGDPVTGPLTGKQREYLSYITVSTNALLAIINNILDLASIDAGAMTLNLGAVDIRKTMEAAAEGVQDRLVKSGITLEIHAPPEIGSFVADERRVRQSLFNLLANAVGFSPAGEIVTFAAQRRRDALVFSVTDRGPGIPADVQNKVFDWFETHSLGSHHRGTGLGLSLVRSFVELHGGSVTLESTVGRGTTVTCVFPLAQTAEQSAA